MDINMSPSGLAQSIPLTSQMELNYGWNKEINSL